MAFFHRIRHSFPTLQLKLDTNGSNPELLEKSLSIVDFLALDYKSLDYSLFSDMDMSQYARSLKLLHHFPESELRITMFPPYLPQEDFPAVAQYLSAFSIPSIAIQTYRPISDTLGIPAYDFEVLASFKEILQQHGLVSTIR